MSWQYWVASYVGFCGLVLLFFAASARVSEAYDRIDKACDSEPSL